MRTLIGVILIMGLFVLSAQGADHHLAPQKASTSIDPVSIVIIFKDGHEETFAMADVARVEYKGEGDASLGLVHFLGSWEAGDGNSGTFFITLGPNGEATRSIGASHGIWTIVGDEARISWDDGWHDILRKVGDSHEKFDFAPGTTLDDQPANVATARKINSENTEFGKISSKP